MSPSLDDLSEKLDQILQTDKEHLFNEADIETLKLIIDVWRSAQGFITVTKRIGIVIAAIVLLWTQGGRLLDMIRGTP